VHASAIPTLWDIGGLFGYLFGNPWLFISSTTVMTSGLLLGAVVVSVLPQRSTILRRLAPTLALILAYFGLGSFLLSVQILARFHDSIPYETEVQFVSGAGHLLEALLGLAILSPYLRRQTSREWLWAHTAALVYWTFQIAVLTPPWFSFQGQRELVMTAALVALVIGATVNAALWSRSRHAGGATPH
jgi:hypothetical protein